MERFPFDAHACPCYPMLSQALWFIHMARGRGPGWGQPGRGSEAGADNRAEWGSSWAHT